MSQKPNLTRVNDSLEKFEKAQDSLERALKSPIVEERDVAGVIKSFEFVFELSWKTLRRLLETLGYDENSPREVYKAAYKAKLLTDEALWLDILDARNLTTHTYDKKKAEELVAKIKSKYVQAFRELVTTIQEKERTL